jgi:hypothetical protein
MGVIEQVSRYDPYVNAARISSQKHFAARSEQAIRRLQKHGKADLRLNPAMVSDALGAMVGRFAELWLTQGYRSYDFDEAVEQLTLIWAKALEPQPDAPPAPPRRSRKVSGQSAGRAAPTA